MDFKRQRKEENKAKMVTGQRLSRRSQYMQKLLNLWKTTYHLDLQLPLTSNSWSHMCFSNRTLSFNWCTWRWLVEASLSTFKSAWCSTALGRLSQIITSIQGALWCLSVTILSTKLAQLTQELFKTQTTPRTWLNVTNMTELCTRKIMNAQLVKL